MVIGNTKLQLYTLQLFGMPIVQSYFCFLFKGAGHWLIAQRVSVENRYKILKQPTSLKHSCTRSSGQSECERLEQRTLKRSGNTLNKEILVRMTASICSLSITVFKMHSIYHHLSSRSLCKCAITDCMWCVLDWKGSYLYNLCFLFNSLFTV